MGLHIVKTLLYEKLFKGFGNFNFVVLKNNLVDFVQTYRFDLVEYTPFNIYFARNLTSLYLDKIYF